MYLSTFVTLITTWYSCMIHITFTVTSIKKKCAHIPYYFSSSVASLLDTRLIVVITFENRKFSI